MHFMYGNLDYNIKEIGWGIIFFKYSMKTDGANHYEIKRNIFYIIKKIPCI